MTPLLAEAVAIDLDGTLIDTESEICSAVNTTLMHFGHAALSAGRIVSLTGRGTKALLEAALHLSPPAPGRPAATPSAAAQLLDAALGQFKAAYAGVLGTQCQVYPGVREGLTLLRQKQLKMVCVTNKAAEEAAYLLSRFELTPYFEALIAPETPLQRKPAPYMLEKAAALLGVPTACMVLVGDSNNDVLAARAAGSPVIRLATGYERFLSVKQQADRDCHDFLAAAQTIERSASPKPPGSP